LPSLCALGLFSGHALANAVSPARAGQFLFSKPEITDSCSLIASWLVPVPLSQAAILVSGKLAAHHESSLILAHSHAGMQAGGFLPTNSTNSANLLDQAL